MLHSAFEQQFLLWQKKPESGDNVLLEAGRWWAHSSRTRRIFYSLSLVNTEVFQLCVWYIVLKFGGYFDLYFSYALRGGVSLWWTPNRTKLNHCNMHKDNGTVIHSQLVFDLVISFREMPLGVIMHSSNSILWLGPRGAPNQFSNLVHWTKVILWFAGSKSPYNSSSALKCLRHFDVCHA